MATRRTADPKADLRRANAALAKACPGDPGGRQPVHTYYTGAQFFHANMARELGDQALAAFNEYAPDGATLSAALGWSSTHDEQAHHAVDAIPDEGVAGVDVAR